MTWPWNNKHHCQTFEEESMLGFSSPRLLWPWCAIGNLVHFVCGMTFLVPFCNLRRPNGPILLPWKQQKFGPTYLLFSEIEFSLETLYHLALVSVNVCNFCLKLYFTNSMPHEWVNEDVDFCFSPVFSILTLCITELLLLQ